ncbi:MAG: sensor histidine kinase [Silicimonas sp.]|nr:sensor histidine kinase [Silicimonas sp.]NND42847.1 sensor histidine kinase [Silicimonas sp.]NNL74380.1 sensor histidine kinase [Silicimonas sp.]
MKTGATSLRLRLLTLILIPLLVISTAAGTWRYFSAKAQAAELFDRNLLAITLAVARDVAVSGGDAISLTTQSLLEQAGGGRVFYHARGPDGSFIAGYAYPPQPLKPLSDLETLPTLFDGRHQGNAVRVSKLTEFKTIDGIGGLMEISVWQRNEQRQAFARLQALKAVTIIGALILTVMAVIWFGVQIGLRPLDDLENAISRRHPDEMHPLRRPVPREVVRLTATLNALFEKVQESIAARDRFISDAAHQLRNPIAAIRAMADSVSSAPSGREAKLRSARVAEAAANASRLSEQLLSLDRLQSNGAHRKFSRVDMNTVAKQVAMRNAERILDNGLDIEFQGFSDALIVEGDPLLLAEAVENLVDNALAHGGACLTEITIEAKKAGQNSIVTVSDNGTGIPEAQRDLVFERFAQLDQGKGKGSGLGLSIVNEIAEKHGGAVHIRSNADGCGTRMELSLPLAIGPAAAAEELRSGALKA